MHQKVLLDKWIIIIKFICFEDCLSLHLLLLLRLFICKNVEMNPEFSILRVQHNCLLDIIQFLLFDCFVCDSKQFTLVCDLGGIKQQSPRKWTKRLPLFGCLRLCYELYLGDKFFNMSHTIQDELLTFFSVQCLLAYCEKSVERGLLYDYAIGESSACE